MGKETISLSEIQADQIVDQSMWDDVSEENELEASSEESAEEEVIEEKEVVEDKEVKEEVKLDSEEESDEEEESEEKEDSKEEAVKELSPENKEEGGDESKEEESKEESSIEVKVNGKLEKVSLQDLKNNYSGKIAYDKKFSEMDKERKSFKAEVDQINTYVSDLGKVMKENSVLEGFYKIGELVNMPAHMIKAALIKEILPEIERMEALTQSEIDLEYQKEESKYYQLKTESDKQKFETEHSSRELGIKVSKAQEALSADSAEWDEAVAYLDKNLPPEEQITISVVKEYIQFNRAEGIVNNALTKFDSSYLGNEEVVSNLQDIIIKNPDFTEQDIQDILSTAFGGANKEVAEKKIVKTISKKQAAIKKTEANEITHLVDSAGNEAMDWDDLDY